MLNHEKIIIVHFYSSVGALYPLQLYSRYISQETEIDEFMLDELMVSGAFDELQLIDSTI